MLKSVRSEKFMNTTDSALSLAYVAALNNRKELMAKLDTGVNVDAELDLVDSTLFCLDDELCARGLDLPA